MNSRANRSFRRNDEAVSPVIGVILMVAITVVLAAVVFVLVSNLSKGGSQSAPTMSISADSVAYRLTVTSASTGADWSRISVIVTSCSQTASSASQVTMGAATPYQNQAAASTGGALNAVANPVTATVCGSGTAVRVAAAASATTVMHAGDFLAFCTHSSSTPPAGPSTTNVNIQLTDTVANSVIGTYTLTAVGACAT